MAAAPVLPASTTMSDPVGQRAIERGDRVAVPDARAVDAPAAAARRGSVGRRTRSPGASSSCSRRSTAPTTPADHRMCTWVHGTNGGADPDREGRHRLARASSSPARAVTVSRVPTSRHNALSRTAPATPGWPITPVTPEADASPGHARRPWRRERVATRAPQHRAQLLEFGAGIVTRHLLTGDDGHRSVGRVAAPARSAADHPAAWRVVRAGLGAAVMWTGHC